MKIVNLSDREKKQKQPPRLLFAGQTPFSRSLFYMFTEQVPIFQEASFEYQLTDRQFPGRYRPPNRCFSNRLAAFEKKSELCGEPANNSNNNKTGPTEDNLKWRGLKYTI